MIYPVPEAVRAAYQWHDGQIRKHTGLPYFVHPVAVAGYVERAIHLDPAWPGWKRGPEHIVSAAYLHDVIEDCGVTLSDFVQEFGQHNGFCVYSLVKEVTEVSNPTMGNRKLRRALDADHYAKSSPAGASIKLADITDNAIGIRREDQKFWKVYQQEMLELLPRLKHGHESLYGLAMSVVVN